MSIQISVLALANYTSAFSMGPLEWAFKILIRIGNIKSKCAIESIKIGLQFEHVYDRFRLACFRIIWLAFISISSFQFCVGKFSIADADCKPNAMVISIFNRASLMDAREQAHLCTRSSFGHCAGKARNRLRVAMILGFELALGPAPRGFVQPEDR